MVRSGSKRSLRLASICSDEVINGGCGFWVRGVDAIEVIETFAPISFSAIESTDDWVSTSTGFLESS